MMYVRIQVMINTHATLDFRMCFCCTYMHNANGKKWQLLKVCHWLWNLFFFHFRASLSLCIGIGIVLFLLLSIVLMYCCCCCFHCVVFCDTDMCYDPIENTWNWICWFKYVMSKYSQWQCSLCGVFRWQNIWLKDYVYGFGVMSRPQIDRLVGYLVGWMVYNFER